jgi:hypothetical protein
MPFDGFPRKTREGGGTWGAARGLKEKKNKKKMNEKKKEKKKKKKMEGPAGSQGLSWRRWTW